MRKNRKILERKLTSATLKSNASLRSMKPMPRNACRREAGSTTRMTKFLLLSEAGSTHIRRSPTPTGHTAKTSPLSQQPTGASPCPCSCHEQRPIAVHIAVVMTQLSSLTHCLLQ